MAADVMEEIINRKLIDRPDGSASTQYQSSPWRWCPREQRPGKEVLYFAGRHHVVKVNASKTFNECMVLLKAQSLTSSLAWRWSGLPCTRWNSFWSLVVLRDELVVCFLNANRQLVRPRGENRKLLELPILALGGIPKRGIYFLRPCPLHYARCLAKIINSIIMFSLNIVT